MSAIFVFLIFLFSSITTVLSIPLINDNLKIENNTKIYNRTIDRIATQQTDAIKNIVNSQQSQLNYHPFLSKMGLSDHFDNENDQKNSFNQIKLKCEQILSLRSNNNNKSENFEKNTVRGFQSSTDAPVNKVKIVTARPSNGFYITSQPSKQFSSSSTPATTEKTTTIPPTAHNIKYIKLEPVILQKTILNDGREIYHWHRKLPSAMTVTSNQNNDYNPNPTQTTTSTSLSNEYTFRDFFSSLYPFGYAKQESTTTTTTTTEKPSTSATTQSNEEPLYTQQLKFVVPLPILDTESINQQQYSNFDPYAYYPKYLQPKTMKVEMPYIPTFHVIKAIKVPVNLNDENNNNNYSD